MILNFAKLSLFVATATTLVLAQAMPTAQAQMSVDAQARLLGGIMPKAHDLEAPEVHEVAMSAQWRKVPSRAAQTANFGQGRALFSRESARVMKNFFSRELGEVQNKSRNVLYLFGGPDVLFPQVIFPNFEKLLLVGLETPGRLPDPQALLRSGQLETKMTEISEAFRSITGTTYFITTEMSKELREIGTSTLIAVGLVANGFEIRRMSLVSLNANGRLVDGNVKGAIPGVRAEFLKPNGQMGEVVYLQMNVANDHMKKRPEFEKFVRESKYDTAYYKAASFVSHNSMFTQLNQIVLSEVKTIVQSDDGLPFSALMSAARDWKLRLYGLYATPDPIFGSKPQRELVNAYAQTLCRRAQGRDIEIWQQMWFNSCGDMPLDFEFASMSWHGTMPFRYGYSGTSGPNIVSSRFEKARFSNLMVLERK